VSAGTEQARWSAPRRGSEGATVVWLNALASGNCTPDAFFSAMRDQFQGDGDEGWEVLSLLDQYYRRGKIKAELFHTLKSRLEGAALGGDKDAAAKVRPHASATVTAPAAASQKKASPDSRSAVREVAIGDVLRGRYKIRGVLGAGGMGTVFEATDEYRLDLPSTGQLLAIKVLHAAVTQREKLLSELRSEFQHLQLLSHPNIVRVHEFDRDGDIAFFTMELLGGALLSRVLSARNANALPRPYALTIMRDVGAALTHAHSRGVVHGDINPQNIFITNDGELRVLDFGASHKFLRVGWTAGNESSQRDAVATPGYASCQLLEGRPPDARDDLFAFACVTYVLLSGRHPFPNRTAIEARAQRWRPPRPPGLTGQQWRVLREGLRWERDRRPLDIQKWLERFQFPSAAPRLASLLEMMNAPPPRKRKVALATAALMMFALLAIGGYWAVTNHDSLARHVTGWSGQARSALEGFGVLPAVPVPAPASVPVITHPIPSPPPPPIPAVPPTPTLSARAAAVTRPSSSEASVRAGNAGPIRVEMAADMIDVQATETTARVTVRRRGNLHGEAAFTWWTESGTAKPGRDFAPVMPRVEQFENGSNSVSLSIPISGTPRSQPKSFYVVIDRTESGAALGPRTLTMVTILPPA
jgi:eukaryotic-like serine/threonine-protein kinase